MASVHRPRYLRIFDIQSMFKYIFLQEKRPSFLQLKYSPKAVLIVKISTAEQAPPSDEQAWARIYGAGYLKSAAHALEAVSTGGSSTMETTLKNIGINTVVHINEHMELDFIFQNILKSIDVFNVNLGCITEEALEMIERHDILHLFSYSTFIKSQADFDRKLFDTFVRPRKASGHFLVAIDCEMVLTLAGPRLGRATVLDHRGGLLYDTYVQPGIDVLDYMEKYSGLNRENTSQGISFGQLQSDILEIVGTDTCVLGHGLENDLEALGLYVDNIIDTAYLFLSPDGHKIKLNQLSKKYLNEKIQQDSHCSHEDALCCLKLLAYKIQQMQRLCASDGEALDLRTTVLRQLSLDDRSLEAALRVPRAPVKRNRNKPQPPSLLAFVEMNEAALKDLPVDEGLFAFILYEKGSEVFIAFRQD